MQATSDIVVIGGGIIGLTSAYYLRLARCSVTVLERGEPGREASWAGAGILPPGNPAFAQSPLDQLRAQSVSRFEDFSNYLFTSTMGLNGYWRCGGVEYLEATEVDEIRRLWDAEQISYSQLTPAELHDLEPHAVAPAGTVPFHLPDYAQVRNPWHMQVLLEACRISGVKVFADQKAIGWHGTDTGLSLVLANGTRLHAAAYLVASGAWADTLLQPLGCRLQVKPVRGQIVLLNSDKSMLHKLQLVGKRYLVPRGDGRILIGSTEEPDAGFVKETTTAGTEGLLAFAHGLVPALSAAQVEKSWAGLRPGSPDGLPYIGPVPGTRNVFAAVGHFRAGVQLSIGSAGLVSDFILNRDLPDYAHAFRLDREPTEQPHSAFRS